MSKRNVLIRLTALMAALLVFFPASRPLPIFAADYPGNNYLTHVNLQVRDYQQGWKPYQPGGVIGYWDVFQLAYEWSIPDEITLAEGDTMTFRLPLPDELRFVTKPGSFPLTTTGGRLIGMADFQCDGFTNEVKVIFTDAVEGLSSLHGEMIFHTAWDTSVVTGGTQESLTLDFTGIASFDVTAGEKYKVNETEVITKWGNPQKNGDDYWINWVVRLNYRASHDSSWELRNASYIDDIGPNQTYRDGSMRIYACVYDEHGVIQPNSVLLQENRDYRLEWSNTFEGSARYTITFLGNYNPLKTSLSVQYACDITDKGASEKYTNYGCFKADCFSDNTNSNAYLFEGSGSASGKEKRPPATTTAASTTVVTTTAATTEPTPSETGTAVTPTNPETSFNRPASTTPATPAPVATTVNTASSLSQTPSITLTTAGSSSDYPTEASPKTGGGVTLLPLTVIGVGAVAAILRPKRR